MPEQLLSALLGKTTSGEALLGMSSKRTENPLQANPGEESFDAKLTYLVKNMSASPRVSLQLKEPTGSERDSSESATNKQAPASIAPGLSLSNQEDINLIMEMVSKGILPEIAGLREQLNQELNNNTNKETFINNGNNNIPDSKNTPVSTQLHTLLVNSEGTLSPAKSMNLNGEEMLTLAKTMKNSEGVSALAKSVQNSEEILSPTKSVKLNGEEMLTLAKTMKNSEGVSTLAKSVQNSEEILSPTKSVKSNGEEILSPTKSVKSNGEEISSLEKSAGSSEEVSPLAKSVKSGEEISSSAKPMENGEEISSPTKSVKSDGEEISSPTKSVKSNGEEILSPTKSVKLNGEKMPSSAKSMKNGEVISSVVKSAGSGEEVLSLPKDISGQGIQVNTSNRVSEQLASQDANKTVPEESNPNLSLRQDSVQAEVEDSELHQALNASKSQEVTTSFNDNNIPGNARSNESTIQTTVSQDNSFLNNQGSDTAKESNVSLTNIKQGIEPKISFANISSQVNVTKPFESLGVDLVDNLIQRARLFMQGDKSTIRIQLNPPELGSLKLEFTVEDDVLEAKIFVERSVVKEIIEKDIPRLRELLADTEVDLGKLDVFLQENEEERLNFMNEGFLSDSGSDQTQEREDFDDGVNEELELDAVSSNKINYIA
ncbi:MAG: flagellar hook-length control protein FliK [Candidatus Scalindua sediminis]|nr:flagellar hook-length control protein FliK [Candidatus Scalindua sediminis]